MTDAARPKTGVRAIEVTSAVDQVTLELRRSILSGDLAPGQEFSLRELAKQLGVSFIPVREALRRLESQGLVVARRGKSTAVAPLNLEDLYGIFRLRHEIEPEIVGRAALLVSEADLENLDDLVGQFTAPAVGADERFELHKQFHLDLLLRAATSWDVRVLEMLWDAAERYVRRVFVKLELDPLEPARGESAHRDLVTAMRSRDPQVASAALIVHLTQNEERARSGNAFA